MAPNYTHDIMEILAQRGQEKSICPSEVLAPNEKQDTLLMNEVREAAKLLVKEEKIIITQKGIPVDPEKIKGPIRLKLKT
jgi:hypothetical protein